LWWSMIWLSSGKTTPLYRALAPRCWESPQIRGVTILKRKITVPGIVKAYRIMEWLRCSNSLNLQNTQRNIKRMRFEGRNKDKMLRKN
jgi:hypothetical protein